MSGFGVESDFVRLQIYDLPYYRHPEPFPDFADFADFAAWSSVL